jgi:hypothetical protein
MKNSFPLRHNIKIYPNFVESILFCLTSVIFINIFPKKALIGEP